MEIIRIRWVSGERTKGCEKVPIEIMKELREVKSKESGVEIDVGKLNLEEIHVDLENEEEAHYLIYENSKESFEKNFKTLFIGGDHSIDYSIVRAFDKIEDNPLLIVFDSRGDCLSGEGEFPKDNSWLRMLIEKGFDGSKIVLIGMRNVSVDEMKFLKKNKVTLIGMDVLQEDLHDVCDIVMERARSSSGFYVSIGMNVVDPCCVPGGVDLDVGGLSSRDLIYFIKRLNCLDNFKGASVNSIDVDKDVNGMRATLVPKLVCEMI